MANLDTSVRKLVADLRISGAAKKAAAAPVPTFKSAPSPPSSSNAVEAPVAETNLGVHDELDDLMNDMGLGDEDEENFDDDDDDLDLR